MPELAEVDYYRKQWDPGLGQKVLRVEMHSQSRVLRGGHSPLLMKTLPGLRLTESESRGKQMLFRFGKKAWLGLHLGMTGKLETGKPDHQPSRHEHLVLFLPKVSLIFRDPRMFGRVLFETGRDAPSWWSDLGPDLLSAAFNQSWVNLAVTRHRRIPIKGLLLNQRWFAGIGNWMADEILWQAGILPDRICQKLTKAEQQRLWKRTKLVARKAMQTVGVDWGDLPKGWLFHERWSAKGICPKHESLLSHKIVAGRSTRWCARCQK